MADERNAQNLQHVKQPSLIHLSRHHWIERAEELRASRRCHRGSSCGDDVVVDRCRGESREDAGEIIQLQARNAICGNHVGDAIGNSEEDHTLDTCIDNAEYVKLADRSMSSEDNFYALKITFLD